MSMVTVPVSEYRKMTEQAVKYNIMLTSLIREAYLNHSRDGLTINSVRTDSILLAMEPSLRSARIFELQAEEEAEKAREDGNND